MPSRRLFLKAVGVAAVAAGGACASRAGSGPRTLPAARVDAGPSSAARVLRLGSNENSFGPGPAARQAITEAIAEANRYPFRLAGDLADAIAASHGVSDSQVLLGNGSGELLSAAVTEFTSPARGLVTAIPTFEMPANRARELGRPVTDVRVDGAGRLDLDRMLDAVAGAGLVYVCNPNNPTATVHGYADLDAFVGEVHRRSPEAVVLVDEAYHEFAAHPAYRTAAGRAAADPRVVVTRTFSKVHGMAGLRVGYAIGAAATLGRLRAWVDAMNMNGIGLAAALRSLADTAHVAEACRVNAAGRAALRAALEAAGHRSFESDANFVMAHVGRDTRAFAGACLARGVQVARAFPPLLEHSRITIGTPDEMAYATRVFLDVLSAADAPATALLTWPDAARGC